MINNILNHLDGWIIESEDNTDLLPTEYNKKISETEITTTIHIVEAYIQSYTQRKDINTIPVLDTAVGFWVAGLLWNKYNIRVNNQIDETNPFGYGDKLIIQAKELLKPYKSYDLQINKINTK